MTDLLLKCGTESNIKLSNTLNEYSYVLVNVYTQLYKITKYYSEKAIPIKAYYELCIY